MATLQFFACGHPDSDENVYVRKSGTGIGRRSCKTCVLASNRDYGRRKRAGEPMRGNANAIKTRCKNGHLFTDANTYIRAAGWRGCRACQREYMSQYNKPYKLKAKYRLTTEERSRLLFEQDGFCAICFDEPATQVDHDHETGRVRGLLCGHCNKAIGLFKDNAHALAFAAEYVRG